MLIKNLKEYPLYTVANPVKTCIICGNINSCRETNCLKCGRCLNYEGFKE